MFLCLQRWGKSTFLNMLAAYYDVNTQHLFHHMFGKLDIGKAPTESHNTHLVLLFDFSTIIPIGSFEDVSRGIFNNISRMLRQFLLKYKNVLGNPSLDIYISPGEIVQIHRGRHHLASHLLSHSHLCM
jgi:hypothetical protein